MPQLDARLKKIAGGMKVSDAVASWLRAEAPDEPIDPAKETADELLAIVELMFLMAAVDGEVSEDEVNELRASVHALSDMAAVEPRTLTETIEQLSERLDAEGWKARLDDAAARVRAPEAREFAFQLAAGVAFVDDFVAHAEAAAIDSLAMALGFEKDDSQRLLKDVHETIFGR